MMKRIFTALLSLLVMLSVHAQQTNVTGRVQDEKGDPVPFATVSETGTSNAVKADANGHFTIKVNSGAQLQVSSSGFAAKTVTASDNLTVVLAGSGNMQEVVITTALGQQRQAKELGYSTAKIRSSELTQAKVVNLQNGLTGKVSGLNVQTVNNGVFADTRITLRGIRSLTGNNQPMLIVDGVPIALGYINSINPNDIADVTILKSSSATAIYGPEGVNGAIVVSTKRGSRNRPSITVSNTTQIESVSFMPMFQDKFGSGSSVDQFGYGVYDPVENQGYGDAFDGSRRQIGRVGPNGDTLFTTYSAKLDEKRKFWNKGITNQTDVSFSTGDFYMSAQNVSISGIVPKDESHRKSLRLSANKEYGKFRAQFNVNYTNQTYDVTAGRLFDNGRDYTPYWVLINTPAHIPITQFKNWRNDYWANPNGYFSDYYTNPYFAIDNFRGTGRSNDLLGNIQFDLKATSWLQLTYRLGGTLTNASDKSIQRAFTYSAFAKASSKNIAQSGDLNGAFIETSAQSNRLNSEFYFTANKTFNALRIEGLAGHSFRETNSRSLGMSSDNLGIPAVFNTLVRKGEPGTTQAESKTRLQRFFGRLSFSYDNWAFAEVTGSYDMDSRLANPYNYRAQDITYFYPGASASVVLSEALASIKQSNVISYAKLRGAVSKTGNVNLGAYNLENTYSPGGGFPYGTLIGFTADNVLRQNSYKPEFVINKEVGIELGFLKNRINFEATGYLQNNTNQIITVAYSAATGFPNALLNAASFENKGLELDLRLTPLIKINDVSINFKANYTYQTNRVNKLIDGVDELGIGNGNFIIKGKPAYTFKLTDYVRDSLGRVIIDRTTGLPTVDPVTRTFGQTIPKHILGLSLNAQWKDLSFSVVADHRSGNQVYHGLGPNMDFTGLSYRSGQNGRQPFIFPNSVVSDGNGKYVPNTEVYTTGGYNFYSVGVNMNAQSNYLTSGAFWKLREVALGYSMPSRWFVDKPIKAATFTLTGRNLVTWLPSTNQWTDPEFSNTTGNAQGVNDLNNTPPTRLFGANLTLHF